MNTKHGKIDVSLEVSLDFPLDVSLDVLLDLPLDLIWDPLEPCKTLSNPLQREKVTDRQRHRDPRFPLLGLLTEK